MDTAQCEPNLMSTHQQQFHRVFGHLAHPHVRALAWLLASPDLLEPVSPVWGGKVVYSAHINQAEQRWLDSLESDPGALEHFIDEHPTQRLGRYAERLLAYALAERRTLYVQNLQVSSGRQTLGEFDFLVWCGKFLLHWELATKFYLYVPDGHTPHLNQYVGPNLADALGDKTRKILERQLTLGNLPEARAYLPAPIELAQALVKGWLFYPVDAERPDSVTLGLNPSHCHGLWCTRAQFDQQAGDAFSVLPRLEWMAPAKVHPNKLLDRARLCQFLDAHFLLDEAPVLVSHLEPQQGSFLECNRLFIVPNDWPLRATAMTRLARW